MSSFGSFLSGVAATFGGSRQTNDDQTQRTKRSRPDEDETDSAFCMVTRTLEGPEVDIDKWSPENKVKLAKMLSMYLGFSGSTTSSSEGEKTGENTTSTSADIGNASRVPGINDFAGAARSDQHLRDTTSRMMITLASAKETLKNLVPRADTDNLSKAPAYEKNILTYEIDSFLFENDEEIDLELVDPGHVSRNYCTKCDGPSNVTTTRFISHSFSRHQLAYIFANVIPKFVLPTLVSERTPSSSIGGSDLRFLDVGSRFGTVPLAAACCLREEDGWSKIQGIELNPKYFNLSTTVLGSARNRVTTIEGGGDGGGGGTRRMDKTFFPEGTLTTSSISRVDLLQGDILQNLNLLKEASLICINNVFEWHMETSQLLAAWKTIRETTKASGKPQFFVTSPSIEDSLDPLFRNKEMFVDEFPPEVEGFVKEWGLKKVDISKEGVFFTRCFFDADAEEQDEEHIQPIHLYALLPPAAAVEQQQQQQQGSTEEVVGQQDAQRTQSLVEEAEERMDPSSNHPVQS